MGIRGVREPHQHNCIAHVKIQRGSGSIKSIFKLLLGESSPRVPLTLVLVSPNTYAGAKAETASPPHNTGIQDQRARNL